MPSLLVLFSLSLGCGSTSQEAPPAAPAVEPTPPAAPAPEAAGELTADAEVLVPSPAELQKLLDEAKIAGNVDKVVADKAITPIAMTTDETAVRTGVLLAHLVLTAKTAPKERTLERMAKAKEGLTALGAGTDIGRTVDDLSGRLENDAINSDDLVVELDEIARVLVPEVSYEAGDRAVPLIQAGGWLAGTHYVAAAMVDAGSYDSAGKLLHKPEVVGYFKKVVDSSPALKDTPDQVLGRLKSTLDVLDGVAKKEAPTPEDVQAVKTSTGEVLALL